MKNALQKVALASTAVVLLKVLFGGMTFKLGAQTIVITVLDPGTIAALLTPTLGAFVTSLHDRFEDADGDGVPDAKPPEKKA